MEKNLEKRIKELERKDDFIYTCIDWLSDITDTQCKILTEHTWLIKELARRVWYYRDMCTIFFVIIIALLLFCIWLSI